MKALCMLDTHIAVALYDGRLPGLSARAKRMLDQHPLCLSPAVVLELELLFEIQRLRVNAAQITQVLAQEFDVSIAADKFAAVVQAAISLNFTRDPFDRLITAHAALLQAPLLSLDERIQAHYAAALG